MSMRDEGHGAAIERGQVVTIAPEGARIKSLTRDGITTPPLPTMEGLTIQTGELVYFFLFDDGRGMVIARIP